MSDNHEGAVVRHPRESNRIFADLHGFDARNHAMAEGIDAPAWKPDPVETMALTGLSVCVGALMEAGFDQ